MDVISTPWYGLPCLPNSVLTVVYQNGLPCVFGRDIRQFFQVCEVLTDIRHGQVPLVDQGPHNAKTRSKPLHGENVTEFRLTGARFQDKLVPILPCHEQLLCTLISQGDKISNVKVFLGHPADLGLTWCLKGCCWELLRGWSGDRLGRQLLHNGSQVPQWCRCRWLGR